MTSPSYHSPSPSRRDDNSEKPFRVLVYSRVSSAQQAQSGHSITDQPEALRSYAKAQGWRVIGELTDPGKTGRNADREGFKALMDSVRSLRPDGVLVTRLSRFMRNARLTLNAVHEMRELRVALICKDEPIDTRQRGIGDMFLAILATMAEWESDRLSEYAKDTRQRLISQGRWPTGRTPFGYRSDKLTGSLVQIEDQAEVVRRIFGLYTERGIGMGSIVNELAADAIPSPTGKPIWGVNVVRGILTNEVYSGRHALGMTAPPIITQAIFDRAQSLRSTNRSVHPPRVDAWPLQNRLRCSVCGSRFKCTYGRNGRRSYRCFGRETNSPYFQRTGQRCTAYILEAEETDADLLNAIYIALSQPENFRAALEVSINALKAKLKDLERDVAPIRRGLEAVSSELGRIEMAWVRGILPPDKLDLAERSAKERQEHLQARMDILDPGRVDELERTQSLLAAATENLDLAANPDTPHSWFVDGFASLLPPEWSKEGHDILLDYTPKWVGETLRELLTRLQAEVWYGPDGLHVKGIITLPVPLTKDEAQASLSTRPT